MPDSVKAVRENLKAVRINYKKLLREKLPPGNDAAKVYAELFIDLDERLTKTELAFAKVVGDLRELLAGQLEAEETTETTTETEPTTEEPQREHDATPFPTGVPTGGGGGSVGPTAGAPAAAPAGAPNKTGPVDDITPNAGGGPAMNPRPNNTPPSAKV